MLHNSIFRFVEKYLYIISDRIRLESVTRPLTLIIIIITIQVKEANKKSFLVVGPLKGGEGRTNKKIELFLKLEKNPKKA